MASSGGRMRRGPAPVRTVAVDLRWVDSATVGRFEHLVTTAVESSSCVVLDMTAVEYVESAAMNVLLRAHRRVREAGGALVLCGCRTQVRRALQLTHLDGVLPCYATLDEAAADRPATGGGQQSPSPSPCADTSTA